MTAKFYYNTAERIVMDKTAYLTEKDSASVRYKGDVDLVKPTFILEADKIDKHINYLYVGGDAKRYYFIDEVTFSQGKILLHCTVDVLHSHKTEIMKNEFIVWRNQTHYNRYLQDDRQITEASSRILTFPSNKGFGVGEKTASYVLTIGGKG